VATFEYNAGGPKFFHAFATDYSLLDKNPLTILGDSSLSSAVVSLDLSASGVATGGSSTITVTSLINTSTKEIEQIPDSGVYVYIIGSNRTTGSATALSGKYDYQYAQVFPVSRVVAGSLMNVIQYATTNEWTLDAQVTYLAGKKQSLYGPTQGLSVYGVFDTDAVSFERVGLGGVSWVSTVKTPQWVAGDYKIQGPGTALAVSESGQGSKFATLKGAGMTNVIKFSNDWTFAYWVKHVGATVGSNESPNFGGLSVQAGQVHVRVQRQSATQFRVFSPTLGASVSHTLATGLTTNLWNHVAVTWTTETQTLKYLVNGVLAATHVNTDVTRTTFGAEFSLAIAEAITGTQTGVYFDDLRIYNRVLTSGEFAALNDIQNYFHTFGTVLPVESSDALVTAMKSARVTETETSATGYSSVNTTFRNQPMKYVLDKTGAKFPATTVNYVHAHAIASGATQKPELFDADKVGVDTTISTPPSSTIFTYQDVTVAQHVGGGRGRNKGTITYEDDDSIMRLTPFSGGGYLNEDYIVLDTPIDISVVGKIYNFEWDYSDITEHGSVNGHGGLGFSSIKSASARPYNKVWFMSHSDAHIGNYMRVRFNDRGDWVPPNNNLPLFEDGSSSYWPKYWKLEVIDKSYGTQASIGTSNHTRNRIQLTPFTDVSRTVSTRAPFVLTTGYDLAEPDSDLLYVTCWVQSNNILYSDSGMTFGKLYDVSTVQHTLDFTPHLTVPNSYWSRFYKQAYADGTAFSSVTNVDSIYAPIAFTANVDLSDTANVAAFFETHGNVASIDLIERYAVKQLEETVLTQAYANISDHTVTEPIVEHGDYQFVIAGKDVAGNVGVGGAALHTVRSFFDISVNEAKSGTTVNLTNNYSLSSTLASAETYGTTGFSFDISDASVGTMYEFEFFFSKNSATTTGYGGLRFGNKDTLFNSRLPPGGGYQIDFNHQFDYHPHTPQHMIRTPGTGDVIFANGIKFSSPGSFSKRWPQYYRMTVVSEGKAFTRNDIRLEAYTDKARTRLVWTIPNLSKFDSGCSNPPSDTMFINYWVTRAHVMNFRNIGKIYRNLFTLNTTITTAEFDKTLQVTGQVVASDTEGATTIFKAFATTQQGLTPDQVRDLINDPVNAAAVYNENDFSAGAAVLTVPKVMDLTGNVYDSSAVNYAHVYLYGTDGVNTKHDALSTTVVDETIVGFTYEFMNQIPLAEQPVNSGSYGHHYFIPAHINYPVTVREVGNFITNDSTTWLYTTPHTYPPLVFDLSNKYTQISFYVGVGEDDTFGGMQQQANSNGFTITIQVSDDNKVTWTYMQGKLNDSGSLIDVNNLVIAPAGTAYLRVNNFDLTGMTHMKISTGGNGGGNNDQVFFVNTSVTVVKVPNPLPHVNITNASDVIGNQLTISGTVFSSVANVTGGVKAAVFDPTSFDLAGADQSALASFVNANGTDMSLTTVVYAVGSFTDFSLSTYFSNIDAGYTTGPLVDGNMYRVVVAAADDAGNNNVTTLKRLRTSPRFTSATTIAADYSTYGWNTDQGWEVAANSAHVSDTQGWNAFDKDPISSWHSAGISGSSMPSNPRIIQIKYPEHVTIQRYRLMCKPGSEDVYYPRLWNLQGSNNNINWTNIGTQQGPYDYWPDASEVQEFDVSFNKTSYMYFRLRVTDARYSNQTRSHGTLFAQFREVEIDTLD
jgi:hypothetical protein